MPLTPPYSCEESRMPKNETELHDGFVLVANYALLSLENTSMPGFAELPPPEDRILFQANRMTAVDTVNGKLTSTLSPDLIVLPANLAQRAHGRQKDTVATPDPYLTRGMESPDEQGVCWKSICTVVEMKVGRKKLVSRA